MSFFLALSHYLRKKIPWLTDRNHKGTEEMILYDASVGATSSLNDTDITIFGRLRGCGGGGGDRNCISFVCGSEMGCSIDISPKIGGRGPTFTVPSHQPIFASTFTLTMARTYELTATNQPSSTKCHSDQQPSLQPCNQGLHSQLSL